MQYDTENMAALVKVDVKDNEFFKIQVDAATLDNVEMRPKKGIRRRKSKNEKEEKEWDFVEDVDNVTIEGDKIKVNNMLIIDYIISVT